MRLCPSFFLEPKLFAKLIEGFALELKLVVGFARATAIVYRFLSCSWLSRCDLRQILAYGVFLLLSRLGRAHGACEVPCR